MEKGFQTNASIPYAKARTPVHRVNHFGKEDKKKNLICHISTLTGFRTLSALIDPIIISPRLTVKELIE